MIELPRTKRASDLSTFSRTASTTVRGTLSPKNTISGFNIPPQFSQGGITKSSTCSCRKNEKNSVFNHNIVWLFASLQIDWTTFSYFSRVWFNISGKGIFSNLSQNILLKKGDRFCIWHVDFSMEMVCINLQIINNTMKLFKEIL